MDISGFWSSGDLWFHKHSHDAVTVTRNQRLRYCNVELLAVPDAPIIALESHSRFRKSVTSNGFAVGLKRKVRGHMSRTNSSSEHASPERVTALVARLVDALRGRGFSAEPFGAA